MKTTAVILITLIVCIGFTGAVAAQYQEDNPYNSLWYDSTLTCQEKMAKFDELLNVADREKYMELSQKGMEIEMDAMNGDTAEYHRLNRLYVDVCRGMEDTSLISDTDMYFLDSYAQNGSFDGAEEYQDFINDSYDAYFKWTKAEIDIETDVVPVGAEFLPLPEKMTVIPDRSYVNSLPAKEKVVEKTIEVPVEVEKVVEKVVPVEVEKVVEVEKEVVKEVAVPEYHTYYVDVPVEVEKEVIKEVPVEVVKEVEVEKIVEVPVEVEKIVYKSFWDSVVDWWNGIFS